MEIFGAMLLNLLITGPSGAEMNYTQISDIRNSGNKKLTPDFGSSAEKNKGRDKGERISGCGCSREPTVAKKSITNPPCKLLHVYELLEDAPFGP